jgi:hypothetical protein
MDDTLGEPLDNCADDKFIWTYSSPEFPMAQVCHACLPFFNLSDVAVIFFFHFLTKTLPISMWPWNCIIISTVSLSNL